jgi:DNA helicase-2/ATP-dependent DNA helicase PcrA
MRERLTKLLGKDCTSQLKMGTFHSLCARFLRKYAKLVDIPENFTVCDAAERYASTFWEAYMRLISSL